MQPFSHYLITRFNLRNDSWTHTRNNEDLLTEEWMNQRWQLFTTYCLPSVLNQSSSQFKWLIYFDEETSAEQRKKISETIEGLDGIYPLYVDGMNSFLPHLKEFIAEDAAAFNYIITSRLDNDDALHRDYVKKIQAQFDYQPKMAIDIIDGLIMETGSKTRLGKTRSVNNPFISFIEKNEEPQTVWSKRHSDWKRFPHILTLSYLRLWMIIIHRRNKANFFSGFGRVSPEVLLDFGWSEEAVRSLGNQGYTSNQWSPESIKNYFRNYSKYHWKRLKRVFKKMDPS